MNRAAVEAANIQAPTQSGTETSVADIVDR
jgi:hypothetical protein